MRFPAPRLTPSKPDNRGRYELNLSIGFKFENDTAALLIMRHSPGFLWPIRAANDGDHVAW